MSELTTPTSANGEPVPAHASPQHDKPSLPMMELHEDYVRPEDRETTETPTATAAATSPNGKAGLASTPHSPTQASLYEQLQNAQSTDGTAAAAAILLARSQELFGLGKDPNALLSEETKSRLLLEGGELKGFADMLMGAPEGEIVTSVWSTLAEKYNNEGSGLTNEAFNLWTSMSSSVEAKELTDASWDVIRRWQEYAATTSGHKLLADGGQIIKNQSGALSSLLSNLAVSLAGTAASAAFRSGMTNESTETGASASTSTSQPIPTIQKETLMKTTRKINQALADDEDVKELLARSSNLLQSYSASPESVAGTPSNEAPKDGSPVSASASATSGDGTLVAGDAAGAALKAGGSYLKSLRESETGSKMLAKATVLLQQNKDLLMPENLTSISTTLVNDVDARQQFITRIKDVALDFLLSYLPTVVVPPIGGVKENVAYEISNIDLGGFKVDSNNVTVTIEDNSAISIHATKIACEMKNLIWSYKKQTFPKLSGKGTADANAREVEFTLKLKLAYPQPNQPTSPTPAPSSSSSSRSQRPSLSASSSSQKRPSSSQQAATSSSSSSPSPAQPIPQSTTRRSKSSLSSSPGSSSPSTSSSSLHPASSSPPSTTGTATFSSTVAGAPVAAPVSVGESILNVVSIDIGQPRLVMESCQVKLKEFEIQIHSGYFKAIYNMLLGLFSDTVKQYLEDTLNTELTSKSVYFLDTINVFAVDYIPLLQRIMVKATKAALEEDNQENEQIQSGSTNNKASTDATQSHATASPPTA